jgi:hypothetical protein
MPREHSANSPVPRVDLSNDSSSSSTLDLWATEVALNAIKVAEVKP